MKTTFLIGSVLAAVLSFVGTAPIGDASPAAEQREFLVAWAHSPSAEQNETVRVEAFPTLAEAARIASGGAINLPADATVEDLVRELEQIEPLVGDELRMSDTVIGIDYTNSSFGGTPLVWSVPNGVGCTGGATYTSSPMPSGWDQVVSSAQAFGGCNTFRHYSGLGQSGSSIACTCSSMGSMDDRTRSLRWTP